jgi:hypothetical protein
MLVQGNFFETAPFSWISVVIRFGLKDDFAPQYRAISRKYGDLPISIEIDSHKLLAADQKTLTRLFRGGVLSALLHVATKYDLPKAALQNAISEAIRTESDSGDSLPK